MSMTCRLGSKVCMFLYSDQNMFFCKSMYDFQILENLSHDRGKLLQRLHKLYISLIGNSSVVLMSN